MQLYKLPQYRVDFRQERIYLDSCSGLAASGTLGTQFPQLMSSDQAADLG
jgi:hypothetical protein